MRFVKIASLVTLVAFVILVFIIPTGISLFWSYYFILVGPVFSMAVITVVAFELTRFKGQPVSYFYLISPMITFLGIFCLTGFVLRLRWYELSF